jgi:hypothetical protein
MSESLADYDERRWKALLEWLEGHGMMVDEDHLLVRPKHVPGTNSFHLPHPRTIKDQHNHWYSRLRAWSVCDRRHSRLCPNARLGAPDSLTILV